MEEQTVNNQVQQPNIPTPPEPKHQTFLTSKLFLITFAVIIFILLLVIGGNYMRNLQLQEQMFPSPPEPPLPPKVTLQPSPVDETADWKTYESSYYSYTIRYPINFELIDAKGKGNYELQLKSDSLLMTFVPAGLPNNIDITNHVIEGLCKINKDQLKTESINNVLFYKSNKMYAVDNMCLNAAAKISYKTDQYSFWIIDIQAKAKNQQAVKLFDQILSTFKFTPASPASPRGEPTGGDQNNQVACTQDAKLCPDGSYVSRQPPTCEFAKCP